MDRNVVIVRQHTSAMHFTMKFDLFYFSLEYIVNGHLFMEQFTWNTTGVFYDMILINRNYH